VQTDVQFWMSGLEENDDSSGVGIMRCVRPSAGLDRNWVGDGRYVKT
jgi:hypothetical protein